MKTLGDTAIRFGVIVVLRLGETVILVDFMRFTMNYQRLWSLSMRFWRN
jgi:hypothetical protein